MKASVPPAKPGGPPRDVLGLVKDEVVKQVGKGRPSSPSAALGSPAASSAPVSGVLAGASDIKRRRALLGVGDDGFMSRRTLGGA